MNSLDKAVKHYKKQAKHGEFASVQLYASGAVHVLEKVVELRDALVAEKKSLWRDRGNPTIANLYYQTKEMVNSLDNLMIGAEGG